MNSSQTAFAIAGSCLVIAGLLLAQSFMGGSSGRPGRVSYSDSPRMADDAGLWDEGAPSSGKRSGSGSGRRRRPRPTRPMTPAEFAMAKTGLAELSSGREIFESAGAPGSVGEQSKLSDARTHLQAAQREFERIGGIPSTGLEASMEECNRLLIQCNRRTILHVGQ